MNGLTRARLLGPAALFAICLALTLPALAAAAAAAPTYTKETQQEFEKQLASGEISSGTFNKRVRNLHITLKDGKLYLYHYGKKESGKLSDELKAHHITVAVLTPAQAKQEAKKPVHHKLRYIAGGILIVVLIVVGVVLLINRRRRHEEE